MILNKRIQARDIVKFCKEYNSIGFGVADLIELKNCIILKLYNAGYSDNEELDRKFKKKYSDLIIYKRHPIIIAEFPKLELKYFPHIVNYNNLEDWCDCYRKEKEFHFMIEID